MNLLLASAGPLTGALEAVAAAIGSGVVIGGFFGGIDSGLERRPLKASERAAVIGSYAGGSISLLFLAIDIVVKHLV